MAHQRFQNVIISIASYLCFLMLFFPLSVLSARILGYFPSSFKSHQIVHCSIANTLAKAGHEVTVLGGTPNVFKNALYKHVTIDGIGFFEESTNDLVNNRQSVYMKFQNLITNVMKSSNDSMSRPNMQQFLQEHGEGSFDLVIVGYFLNNFHLGLGGHFKCPIIISIMYQPISPINIFIGNPNEVAYVPTVFSGLTQPMSFVQRVKNVLSHAFDRYALDKIINRKNSDLYDYHFPSSHYPSFEEVAKNVSLVFSNHHSISQGPIRPNVPALIEIGGIHIKEKPDPLPKDITKILENTSKGIIYFSFGSNVPGNAISSHKAKAMFNVLSKLPYKVLWKWDSSNYPGISKNIFYKSWLPQDDILAHSNTKLFITHGGYGSVAESQYHGVPMVVIPLYGDQFQNAETVVKNGFGVQLNFETLTEDSFKNSIEEVFNTSEYRTTIRRFSKLYRDRPVAPSQQVLYWTEYVLRYNGARHMKSPALFLNEFQLLSLDVICFLIGIFVVLVMIIVKCTRMTIKKFIKREKRNDKKYK